MATLNNLRSLATPPQTTSPPHSDSWTSRTARSETRWGRCGAVISVSGELDAANSSELAAHVRRSAGHCEWFVLDLSELTFIGTAGFTSLKVIADHAERESIRCRIVAGIAVGRLLRICDPASTLPTAPALADALAGIQVFQRFA
ncbi:STAS domain-containing protein [Mycolicibacter minnesotensis]